MTLCMHWPWPAPRWALTVNHWDDRLHEMDVNEEPLSVYYPIVPARK